MHFCAFLWLWLYLKKQSQSFDVAQDMFTIDYFSLASVVQTTVLSSVNLCPKEYKLKKQTQLFEGQNVAKTYLKGTYDNISLSGARKNKPKQSMSWAKSNGPIRTLAGRQRSEVKDRRSDICFLISVLCRPSENAWFLVGYGKFGQKKVASFGPFGYNISYKRLSLECL